jgi:predicted MPP superfamily phosphohydrolase
VKPSEAIKEKAAKIAKENPNSKIFSIDYVLAIIDYLDEEYEEKKKEIQDLIA